MSRGTLDPACCHPISPTGLSPPAAGFPKTVRLSSDNALCSPQPQVLIPGLGSSHFARRYFGNRCFFLFLALLRCFSSGGSLPCVMDWRMDDGLSPAGFPHSDIPGSQFMCNSPRLFAAYHVFHRLLVPRHPPCALISLTMYSVLAGKPGNFSCLFTFSNLAA